MLREANAANVGPLATAGAYRAPAVLDPTTPPGVAAEGGPTTPLTRDDLPKWIDDPRVDSQAMLAAFLAYRGRCEGEAYTQLAYIYMIDHLHEPTVVVDGQVIRPQEVRPLPTQQCTALGCERCRKRRGGYQFVSYIRLRRKKTPGTPTTPTRLKRL